MQAAISKAARQLPQNMPTPPSYQKVNPADQPVLYLALSSPTLPLSDVNEFADTIISPRISMINGVAQVLVYGSQKYAVRVQLDPQALTSRKIGLDEVAAALDKWNVNLPTGGLQGAKQAFTIQASGQLYDADAFKPLIVAYRGGAPVRLQDIAVVTNSVENDKIAAWYNTKGISTRAIVLAIQRQPGVNTIEVVDSIPWKNRSVRAYRRPWCASRGGWRNRLPSMGVNVSDTKPETRMAALTVTANSRNKRPSIPPMNRTGMNTAARERVMDTMVKPISRDPMRAASKAFSPSSM